MDCKKLQQDFEEILKAREGLVGILGMKKLEIGDIARGQKLKKELKAKTKELEKKLWPFEHLSLVSVKEQYESQKEIFEKIGILKKLKDDQLGIKGLDPDDPKNTKEYPFPTLEAVKKRFRENKEKIDYKSSQGFTRLQLTPFAMSIPDLDEIVSKQILKHHEAKQLFTAKKDPSDPNEKPVPLELNEKEPLRVWGAEDKSGFYDPNAIVYYPKQFITTEQEKKDPTQKHEGQTKAQIIQKQIQTNDPFLGWEVKLFEDNINIPSEGEGQTIGDRPQLEANQPPKEYLTKIKDQSPDSPHLHESGLTPEDWLTKFVTHLTKTNQVIDDYKGHGKVCYLLGTWFPGSGYVGYADWTLFDRQACLGSYNPDLHYDYNGSCSAVRLRQAPSKKRLD